MPSHESLGIEYGRLLIMGAPLHVIFAPDSFKGSIGAADVAHALERGWRSVRPNDIIASFPQADGGEGTLNAIAAAVHGTVLHDIGPVTGPDGRATPGLWLELPGLVGVVELAQCSGLPLMKEPDPLAATTRGLGEVIRHALESGMHSLMIGLGGSASTDGGAGALSALGLELYDGSGKLIEDGGGSALVRLANAHTEQLLAPPAGGVTLLADVTAPLLGPAGAASVFGPQKGAQPDDVVMLEEALANFARHLDGRPEQPGSGAAGGAAYGFATLWGAHISFGARKLHEITGLDHAISRADVVITGEGQFDDTSLAGKVVGEILTLAKAHSVRAGIVAGTFASLPTEWTCSLTELAGSTAAAKNNAVPYLEHAGAQAAQHFATAT